MRENFQSYVAARLNRNGPTLLENDSSIISPDVLADDRAKFEASGDHKFVDKAHRRGKIGWDVGKHIEVIPHYRRPHMALVWTGHGRVTPKIVPRPGKRCPSGGRGEIAEWVWGGRGLEEYPMNPSDFSNETRERCLLCGGQPKAVREDFARDVCHVVCEVCGRYGLTSEVFWAFRSGELASDMKPSLSAIVRRHFKYTGKPETLTLADCRQLASQTPDKSDTSAKVHHLLGFLAHKSQFPGDKITLNGQTDFPICFAANTNEFGFYIQHIREGRKFVDEHSSVEHAHHQYSLTPKGWDEARTITDPVADSASSSSTADTKAKPEPGVMVRRAAAAHVQPFDAPADVRPSGESKAAHGLHLLPASGQRLPSAVRS